MPRLGTDEDVKKRIYVMVENNTKISAGEILIALRARAKREGSQEKFPTERTIARIKKEYLSRKLEERLPYKYFSWPESMESEALPWEASRPCLDLLCWLRENGVELRPTIGAITWFWRVTQAAPDAPIGVRWGMGFIASGLGRTQGGAEDATTTQIMEKFRKERKLEDRRRVEAALIYRPWFSPSNSRAYNRAIRKGKIPSCRYPGSDHLAIVRRYPMNRELNSKEEAQLIKELEQEYSKEKQVPLDEWRKKPLGPFANTEWDELARRKK